MVLSKYMSKLFTFFTTGRVKQWTIITSKTTYFMIVILPHKKMVLHIESKKAIAIVLCKMQYYLLWNLSPMKKSHHICKEILWYTVDMTWNCMNDVIFKIKLNNLFYTINIFTLDFCTCTSTVWTDVYHREFIAFFMSLLIKLE